MTRSKLNFALVLLLFVFVPGIAALAYVPQKPAPTPVINLAGQLLVANHRLTDPNFAKTVIYLVAHTEEGAMGLVVNRVYGTVSLRALLEAVGIKTENKREIVMHFGGPVELSRGFVLHSPDYAGASTQIFGKEVALSTGLDIMQALADGRGPKRALFLAGYAGWGAGQLELEVRRNDWLTAPTDPSLIFSDDPDTVWEKALRRAGISL